MFTGIIETLGTVIEVVANGSNKTFRIGSPISGQLRVDQSIAHNGVCLTVERAGEQEHWVTAVKETLDKSNLGDWKPGDIVNLERSLAFNGQLDGHLVQGHVDATGACLSKSEEKGSWKYRFSFPPQFAGLVIEKGSISLNGISLTVFDVSMDAFSVAIIPYTHEHTNMKKIFPGSRVNLEFDLIGKYIQRNISLASNQLS